MIQVTKKRLMWIVLGVVILLMGFVWISCGEAEAAEPAGTPFVAVQARYIEDLGGGVGGGYQFKSGIVLLGLVTYDQFNAKSGTTQFNIDCRNYSIPYSVPSSGHRGIEVTVAIPLRKTK